MKKHIGLLIFSAATLIGLGSCGVEGGEAGGSVSVPSVVEVEKKFAITVSAEEGVTVTIAEATEDNKYSAGSTVSFTATAEEGKGVGAVTVGGKKVAASEGVYSFVMPNQDVEIKATAVKLGDKAAIFDYPALTEDQIAELPVSLTGDDLNTVSKVQDASNELKEIFASNKVEMTKLGKATVKEHLAQYSIMKGVFNKSVVDSDLELVAGLDGMRWQETYTKNNGVYGNFQDWGEKGFVEGNNSAYYEISSEEQESNSYGTHNVVKKYNGYIYRVVEDEKFDEAEAKKSAILSATGAKEKALTTGILEKIGTMYFAPGNYSNSNTSTSLNYVSGGSLYRYINKWNVTVAEDKMSWGIDIGATWEGKSSDTAKYTAIKVTFGADDFCEGIAISETTYDKGTYDFDNHTLKEGATITAVPNTLEVTFTRGYKSTFEKYDMSTWAMSDYDLRFELYNTWRKSFTTQEEEGKTLEVEVGSSMRKFAAVNKASDSGFIQPIYAGCQEGDEFVSKGTTSSDLIVFNKVGTVHLVFENYFGSQKVVTVNVVAPKPFEVALPKDMATKCKTGETITFKPTITPVDATQTIVASLPENDPTESTVAVAEDGTVTWSPTKAGTVNLTIASKIDASVSTKVSMTAVAPATKAWVEANLPTTTLVSTKNLNEYSASYSSTSWWNVVLNLNADGTGSYQGVKTTENHYGTQTYLSRSSADADLTFKWAVADATEGTGVVVTLSEIGTGTIGLSSSGTYTLEAIAIESTGDFNVTFKKTGTTDTLEVPMKTMARVEDLTTVANLDIFAK